MPSGQGSARQHTPQPLHGAPTGGLTGARAWMRIRCTLIAAIVVHMRDAR